MDGESRYRAVEVRPGTSNLWVRLVDGREVSASYELFPRLAHAISDERERWELIGGGTGIHWSSLDEDISIYSIVHPELTRLAREPREGEPAPCRICGQPGRWVRPHPSLDFEWLESRCAAHTPEDDYT